MLVHLWLFSFLKTGGFKVTKTYETIDELSERTRRHKSWWYSRTREIGPDSVPRLKVGKYLLFVPEEVDEWLRKQSEGK